MPVSNTVQRMTANLRSLSLGLLFRMQPPRSTRCHGRSVVRHRAAACLLGWFLLMCGLGQQHGGVSLVDAYTGTITWAGDDGPQTGFTEGVGTNARFANPSRFSVDRTHVYLADANDNSIIWQIDRQTANAVLIMGEQGTESSQISDQTGGLAALLDRPQDVWKDRDTDWLYATDGQDRSISRIDVTGDTTYSYLVTDNGLNQNFGICGPPGGAFVIAVNKGTDRITYVEPPYADTNPGNLQNSNQWDQPAGCVVTQDGTTVYVAGNRENAIIKVDIISSTSATRTDFVIGLNKPLDVTLAPDERTMYIANTNSHEIWSVDMATQTTNWIIGTNGYTDGPAQDVKMRKPIGIGTAWDGECLYWSSADQQSHMRKLFFPIISSAVRTNSVATAAISVTIIGMSFGVATTGASKDAATSMGIRFGITAAEATDWESDTSAVCKTEIGDFGFLDLQVTTNVGIKLIGTLTQVFTFDSINAMLEPPLSNVPTTGSVSTTIIGSMLGHVLASQRATVRRTVCETTLWISATATRGRSTQGRYFIAHDAYLVMSMGLHRGAQTSVSDAVSYNKGRHNYDYTSQPRKNGATTGAASVTVIGGSNFGVVHYSVRQVRVGATDSTATLWVSGSSVHCRPSTGAAGYQPLMFSVFAGVDQTITKSWTFDLGHATNRQNAVASGSYLVTVLASNLGHVENTHRLRSPSASEWTDWTADTYIRAALGVSGIKGTYPLAITTVRDTGTLFSAITYTFQFDPRAYLNVPTTGSTSVTVLSTTGGDVDSYRVDFSVKLIVGNTPAEQTDWASATSLLSRVASAGTNRGSTCIGLTIDIIQMQTMLAAATYDIQVGSSMVRHNSGATGATSVTVVGRNFGVEQVCAKSSIGRSVGEQTLWKSDTATQPKVAMGVIANSNVRVTFVPSAPTSIESTVSYDEQQFTAVLTSNLATTASTSVTVVGRYGETETYSHMLRVGISGAETSLWISTTSVYGRGASGVDSDQSIISTISVVELSITSALTFGTQLISGTIASNAVSTGSTSVTVVGTRFGSSESTSRVRAGGSQGRTTAWVSNSAVSAKLADTTYSTCAEVAVTAITRESFTVAMTVDVMETNSAIRGNAPSTGATSVTVIAASLQSSDSSVIVQVAQSTTEMTIWVSDTVLHARDAHGWATDGSLVATAYSYEHTLTHVVSYDRAEIISVHATNMASTASASVTVIGSNFEREDRSRVYSLGKSSAGATVWVSSSTVSAKCSGGRGFDLDGVVTVAFEDTTLVSQLSYNDRALLNALETNYATTASTSVTVIGASLGVYSGLSRQLSFGNTAAEYSLWADSTSLRGKVCAGSDPRIGLTSTTAMLPVSVAAVASYNHAPLSSISPTNFVGTAATSVTVVGENFATYSTTPAGRLRGSATFSSRWSSSSAVTCKTPPSPLARNEGVSVSSGTMKGTVSVLITFDKTIISSGLAVNVATTGSVSVTIVGHGVTKSDQTRSTRLGVSSSAATAWISSSAVHCKATNGIRGEHRVVVSVTQDTPSLSTAISFDGVVVSNAVRVNTAATGASYVTIVGCSVGHIDITSRGLLGGSASGVTAWVSDSTTRGLSLAGLASWHNVGITVLSETGTDSDPVSYDVTTHPSSPLPTNAPRTGASSVTVVGSPHMLQYDQSISMKIGRCIAAATMWIAATSLRSKAALDCPSTDHVIATVLRSEGTATTALTHNYPIVSSAIRTNKALTGATSVTVVGTGIGLSRSTIGSHLGGSAVFATLWTSSTAITIKSTDHAHVGGGAEAQCHSRLR